MDPAAIEAFRNENAIRPREHRVVDFGWTRDGELWIAIRLPQHFENQVFGIPSALERLLAGRDFDAVDDDGVSCGRVRVYSSGQAAGYAPFLRRSGADEGDLLIVRFDLALGSVILGLTDDDGLDELSPQS